MKKLFTLLFAVSLCLNLPAQITITRDDMPNVGDTIRLSNAAILSGFDPSSTGPDYYWDFTNLEPQTQVVEGYVSTQSTPFLYQIIFNTNVANLASPITDINFLPGFEVTDAYIFYKESNTSYVRAGYAASIAGVPVPMKFDLPELLYTFPLGASSPADSSSSSYNLSFPGIGYFSIDRKRVNVVDGWGTLTTPFGTYNTLRVRSSVQEYDSIYIDSIQFGVPVNRIYTEYKWIANGHSIPVMTITQEGPLTTAQYIDTVRNLTPMSVSLGADQTICRGTSATLTAEVTGGTPPYSYLWNTLETTATIVVEPSETTTFTVIVTDLQNNISMGSITVNVNDFKDISLGADTLLCANFSINFEAGEDLEEIHWFVNDIELSQNPTFVLDSTGIGLNEAVVRLEYLDNGCSGSDEVVVNFYICGSIQNQEPVLLTIAPNPVKDYLSIEHSGFTNKANVLITSASGQMFKLNTDFESKDRIIVRTESLKAGNYLIIISEGNKKGIAKFIKN
ncbi:MAG: T9SS type A sorting domain-containing protein [Bacteroidales bacterium]|nr:T9SS type A sorting domain-containing protein [Bacteroidales bacterium]